MDTHFHIIYRIEKLRTTVAELAQKITKGDDAAPVVHSTDSID